MLRQLLLQEDQYATDEETIQEAIDHVAQIGGAHFLAWADRHPGVRLLITKAADPAEVLDSLRKIQVFTTANMECA